MLDVMAAIRSLVRAPRFFVLCVGTLGVGIGVSAALFSILNAIVLRPLPFKDQERIVVGWKNDRSGTANVLELSYPEFVEWQQRATSFERLAALPTTVYGYSVTLTGRGDPVEVESTPVSADFFEILGVKPRLGRTFTPADDNVGAVPVVVVTDDFWRNMLGADPRIVGAQIELSGRLVTVIGVLHPGFMFPKGASVFTPLGANANWATNRSAVFLQILGKLRPSVEMARARDELNGIISATADTERNKDRVVRLTPIADYVIGQSSTVAILLFGGALVLLVVAAANLAGLLASRSIGREIEIATRMALGANRGRLRTQFLSESVVVVGVGALAGVLVAVAIVRALVVFAPVDMVRVENARIDGSALLFVLACVIAVTVVTSLAPLMTFGEATIIQALRAASAGGIGRITLLRLNRAIVGAEIAVTIALLIVTASVLKTTFQLSRVNTGFNRRDVLTAGITLSRTRYPDSPSRRVFFKQLLDRLESDRSVAAAAGVALRPLEGTVGIDMHYVVPGQTPEAVDANPVVNYEAITPNYFAAIGTQMLAGRGFDESDDNTKPLVAIISEGLAKKMYASAQNAVGRSFQTGRPGATSQPYTIVGVVADARYRDMAAPSQDVFVPYTQSTQAIRYVIIRSKEASDGLGTLLRSSIADIDPQQASSREQTLQALIDARLATNYFYSRILSIFGFGAVLLSAIGTYAFVSEVVARRMRELALRVALGGTWRAVSMVVFRAIVVPTGGGA
ncbi:MAG: ABC transporter permease, partial [Acidobacteriaceae bacterium]|nr:ABC transporter permease [Acidobacteriaceae bacterium]